MKIVLAPMGTRGDVYPLVYLGKALFEAGHEVVLCTSPDNKEFIESLNLNFVPSGDAFSTLVEKMKPYMAKPLSIIKPAKELMTGQLDMIWETLSKESQSADLIIASGAQPIAATVAEHLGIRYMHILHLTQVLPNKSIEPILFSAYNLPPFTVPLLWKLNDIAYNIMLRKAVNDIRCREKLNPITSYIQYINSGQMLVSIAPELSPLPADLRGRATQIDYLFPNLDASLSSELTEFLDAGEPPVFIGFGSMSDKKPAQTLTAILEMVDALNVRCILSRGWSAYGNLENKSIFMAGTEPHEKLFPRCSVVVHHGGAGTVSMASKCGVPQLIIPQMLDQFYWARRVKELGIGTSIRRNRFTGRNVTKAVITLLSNSKIKQKSNELASKLNEQNGIKQLITMINKQVGDE